MKRFMIPAALALVAFVSGAWVSPAAADQTAGRHNKTENGAGCALAHSHNGQCLSSGYCVNGAPCPTNATCESAFGFSSAHRKYSWTNAWNCHGRTFDNRGSWTNSAELFVTCANGVCPVTPQIGDAILWSNGAVHSVTIKGTWNGTSTLIRSKYGCCGEYEHALSNSINTYGSNWVVVRLFNSPVYFAGEEGGIPLGSPNLNEAVKSLPWHSTVLASAVEYAVEHPRRVWESGKVAARTLERLRATEDPKARIEILVEDLRDPNHYAVLAAYERPIDSMDFIEGIEAGRALVRVAREYPTELREVVVGFLEATTLDAQAGDGARAAAILFVSRILDARERSELAQRIGPTLRARGTELDGGMVDLVDHYTREFLASERSTE